MRGDHRVRRMVARLTKGAEHRRGEGGRLIEEEEGRRVGSPEEGGMAGVAALQPNSDEGRGSRCSSTL
jgi:hypothetical protein